MKEDTVFLWSHPVDASTVLAGTDAPQASALQRQKTYLWFIAPLLAL